MNYKETIDYLYTQSPLFQQIGEGAYKEGLGNTIALDNHDGFPSKRLRTIHIAGTNGKGSISHTLAAILQAAGYKTGLYTSPHLIDFRERIRVDGKPVSKKFVIDFVKANKDFLESLHPSFFEVTTAMAFRYFDLANTDIAVIETGLGGRLDCTNIITPLVSVITNIGYDHMQQLGDTLEKIAAEKAGIIKPGIPVVIGETDLHTRPVFEGKAAACCSEIVFAQDECKIISKTEQSPGIITYQTTDYSSLESGLTGDCQEHNVNTILHTIQILRDKCGIEIPDNAVRRGFKDVCTMTGLRGRWQTVATSPSIICDTGHNSHGLKYVAAQLERISNTDGFGKLRIVFGMVADKDIEAVLSIMPSNARYYFTKASVKRALDCNTLATMAARHNLNGNTYANVADALASAIDEASENDLIFIGGSSYIVADLFSIPQFAYKE